MKQVVVVPRAVKRNPLVALAMFRKAGGHRKSNKSIRQNQKSELRSSKFTD